MTQTARRPAISYTRFSNATQQGGDSQDRQDRLFRGFCELHNLTPVKEAFADRGRSGYKDEHRKKGRLGQLIAMAADGHFEPGTVVVVEAWDRLGRLRPDKQTELVAELLRAGVRIGVCRLNDIFSEDDFGTHKWTTLAVFIQLAYQESKQKAERLASAWKTRRERARKKAGEGEGDVRLLVGALPAWLEVAGGKARLIPERADAIRRIFRMAADGLGVTRILAALEREGVPAFGEPVVREGRCRAQFSGRWTRPYVARLLSDRRAVGEVQPRTNDGAPEGPPIAGALPAAVTEEEYQLARAGAAARKGPHGNGRQGRYVNAFRGLLRHARDGEGFMLDNRGTAARPELILLNAAGREGRGRNYTFPYGVFEEAVLSLLREVSPADVLPRAAEGPSRADVMRARLANIRGDIAQLKGSLKAGYSKALDAVLREKEAEDEAASQELQDELAKNARPAERAWRELPGLIDVLRSALDPDEARMRLRAALLRVVESAHVLIVPVRSVRLVAVQVYFAGGEARRDYLIYHKAAGNHRAGGWWARSLAHVVGNAGLDLRRPEHAERLERALLAVPPEHLTGA